MNTIAPTSPLKHPSAWLPLALSLASVGLIVLHLARYGVTHDTDEGTSAHLFQIFMVLQVPTVGFFALTWLPRAPGPALRVLALQGLGIAAAFASLYYMEHLGA